MFREEVEAFPETVHFALPEDGGESALHFETVDVDYFQLS